MSLLVLIIIIIIVVIFTTIIIVIIIIAHGDFTDDHDLLAYGRTCAFHLPVIWPGSQDWHCMKKTIKIEEFTLPPYLNNMTDFIPSHIYIYIYIYIYRYIYR